MINPENYWIETFTGKRFHILAPKPGEIDIIDIAHAESLLCRYTGQVKRFYSIADHSIRASMMVPRELALAALLHDASEAYISDISRPLKHALPMYRDIEAIVQTAIYDRYGIEPLSFGAQDLIKQADNILLISEARDLLPGANYKEWGVTEPPLPHTIEPITSEMAYAVFLCQFNRLCREEDIVSDNIVVREPEVQIPLREGFGLED